MRPHMTAEERRRSIAEAAYYRAQARGFAGGDPLDDWLSAEAEIDAALREASARVESQDVYERLREEIESGARSLRDTVDPRAVQDAIGRAADNLKSAGDHAVATVNQITDLLRKDFVRVSDEIGPGWDRLPDKGAYLLNVWRDRGAALFARAAQQAGEWLSAAGQRWERREAQAGQIVPPGRFACEHCDSPLKVETPAPLPPCPNCAGTQFRRLT